MINLKVLNKFNVPIIYSDDGSDRTENEMDTDVSDEQMPSSSDDEFLHMHDNSDSMDENNHMDPNEFLRQVVEDDDNDNDENNIVDRRENATSSRIVQPRLFHIIISAIRSHDTKFRYFLFMFFTYLECYLCLFLFMDIYEIHL